MKKIVLALSVVTLVFSGSSCLKDTSCSEKSISSETPAMTAYATAHGMTTTTHSSGMLYQITNPGTGTPPTLNSTVKVRYTGKLMDDHVFDSQTGTPVQFQVGGTVPGFQLALQLLGKGGTIRVIIPSALAYGCTGNGAIPRDAILYFDIELVDIL